MSPALVEFTRLQTFQKASIPSPRAVAHLSGFKLNQTVGDALIVEAIPDALDVEQAQQHLSAPARRNLVDQIIQIVHDLGAAKFGHQNLSLDSFFFSHGKAYFHDVGGLRSGGMRLNDLYTFGHNASQWATTTELVRGWHGLNPDYPFPTRNPMSPSLWRRSVQRAQRENEDFGLLRADEWSGVYSKGPMTGRPWSVASKLRIGLKDWQNAWPTLLSQLQSGQLTTIKADPSGEVLEGQAVLAGRPIDIIVKRPGRKFWYRYLVDVVRPSRAKRMWQKAWMLAARNLPSEWPMLVMEKRVMGYVTDAVTIFERVPGPRLDKIDLDSLPLSQRAMLFHRAGRILRRIERTGLAHTDAKSTNWIVYDDPRLGPSPIMVDSYGIMPLTFFRATWGIRRLLRAMLRHRQYTPEDSLALCRGYAPFAAQFEQETMEAGT